MSNSSGNWLLSGVRARSRYEDSDLAILRLMTRTDLPLTFDQFRVVCHECGLNLEEMQSKLNLPELSHMAKTIGEGKDYQPPLGWLIPVVIILLGLGILLIGWAIFTNPVVRSLFGIP